MNKRIRNSILWLWNNWLREMVVFLAIMVPLRSAIADWNQVPTGSMKPTILEGDRVFVNKLAYDLKIPLTTWHLATWDNPKRGDIIVFYSPKDKTRLVKRVIGTPGDTVELQNNRLFINGQPAEYSKLDSETTTGLAETERSGSIFATESIDGMVHPVMASPLLPARRSFSPVTVPPDKYLALGDNRDNSADSRYFGFVERDSIVGRVPAVVMSFNRDNFYLPRSKRWFKRLP